MLILLQRRLVANSKFDACETLSVHPADATLPITSCLHCTYLRDYQNIMFNIDDSQNYI